MMKHLFYELLLASMSLTAVAQVSVPSTLNIPDEATFATAWKVIDANADGKTWTFNVQGLEAQCDESFSNDADDWLIFKKGVMLEAGMSYNMKYYVRKGSKYSSDFARYAITIGNDITIKAQSVILAQNDNYTKNTYEEQVATFTPAESGIYYIGVHAYNKRYLGGIAFQKIEVEKNVVRPMPVTHATLTAVDGHPVVSFTAPAKNTANEDIDASMLTYRIMRLPDSVEVVKGLDKTSFTDLETLELASYSYVIFASHSDIEGEGCTTNSMVFGQPVTLPYSAKFSDATSISTWSIVDANADGKTWSYNASEGDMRYNKFAKADDWLFTPPFTTVAGKHVFKVGLHGYNYRYSDAFDIVLASSTMVGNLEPAQGTTQRVSSVEGSVILKSYEDGALQRSMFDTDSVEFTITEPGVYYIGIHDVTTNPWGLFVNGASIALVEPAVNTAVAEVKPAGDGLCYNAATSQLEVTGEATITVLSMSGTVVAHAVVDGSMSLSHLEHGVYVAMMKTSTGVKQIKFIK